MGRLKKYSFKAELKRFQSKGGWYYLEFPYSMQKEFGTNGYVRVVGTVNGEPIKRSLLSMKTGFSFFAVPLTLRKKLGLELGQSAKVELQKDESPVTFSIPEELDAVFDIEPEVKTIFEKQSKSIQKEICRWIDSGKREETRANRAAEIYKRLTTHGSTFGGRPIKR